MQLSPREIFTVFRILDDHTDGTTYFVRAVIRNARTSELIATVNLTKQSGVQEYKQDWQVPADTSGLGFYITVVTSVYTDSGYTTKSTDYGDEGATYLIDVRKKSTGGGGGVGVDYEKLKKIFEEAVRPLIREGYDDSELLKKIEKTKQSMLEAVKSIDIPEPIDPIPATQRALETAIKRISGDIAKIKIKDPEKPDFSEILESINELSTELSTMKEAIVSSNDLRAIKDDIKLAVAEIVSGAGKNLKGAIDELKPKPPRKLPKHNL